MSEAPRIYPTFRYDDAGRMIDWLVEREKELDYRPPGARK